MEIIGRLIIGKEHIPLLQLQLSRNYSIKTLYMLYLLKKK